MVRELFGYSLSILISFLLVRVGNRRRRRIINKTVLCYLDILPIIKSKSSSWQHYKAIIFSMVFANLRRN